MKMLTEEERDFLEAGVSGNCNYVPSDRAREDCVRIAFQLHASHRMKVIAVQGRRRLVPSDWGLAALRVDALVRQMGGVR